jgi:hypothetical protein
MKGAETNHSLSCFPPKSSIHRIEIPLYLDMGLNKKMEVKGIEISIFHGELDDFISLTDIARYKDSAHTDTIIQNWLRNRNTIELLGFWEQLYNPNFKPLESEGFGKQAGLNSFVLTPKR